MFLALFKLVGGFLSAIPPKVWLFIGIIVGVLIYTVAIHQRGFAAGQLRTTEKYEQQIRQERDAHAAALKVLQDRQAEIVTVEVIKYRDRVRIVKEKGDEVVRIVERLVPVDAPLLSGGLRIAHDAAASGVVPDDPERAAGAAPPVEAVTYAATVAANYNQCNVEMEKLRSLQALVAKLAEVKP